MSGAWTLLIADDCPEDREVYREYLSSDPDQSYQFIEAGSAEVGLSLCQKQHCDAILLDFQLPDMTGLEFLAELKQQMETPLPVIMLTGQGDERVAVQAMKQGVQDYLIKQDLDPNLLQFTVRNVIQQFHLQNRFHSGQEQRQLPAEVALHLHQSLDLEQILQTAVTEVRQVLECDRVLIYQVSQNGDYVGDQVSDAQAMPLTLTRRWQTGLRGDDQEPIPEFVSFLTPNYSSGLNQEQSADLDQNSQAAILAPQNRQETYLLAPIPLQLSTSTPQVWGLLVACQMSNRYQWQADEVCFLRNLASQLAIALHQAEQLHHALKTIETEKQLNAVKSQVVATVSHEYRSSLATILAAASTLKLHSSELHESKQQQVLQMIEAKARQMTQLVDDLLVLETFEVGKVNFDPMPFELLQFVSSLIEEQRVAVGDHHELSFKITGNTKGFWGDQQLLRLILVNLLTNAIKYSPEGGAIDVYLSGNDTQIVILVKDEGMGIPTEDQPRLFQSFSRGSNVGAIPGTGLGLAIVKACVDLHSGEVTLASQAGQGTQVTVCLPKRSASDSGLNIKKY